MRVMDTTSDCKQPAKTAWDQHGLLQTSSDWQRQRPAETAIDCNKPVDTARDQIRLMMLQETASDQQ